MRRSRFSEEQILAILREQETGKKAVEICETHRISLPTFYGWRNKYGGLSVAHAKRLKQLEGENRTLRRLLATALLANAVLKSGKGKGPEELPGESSTDPQHPSEPSAEINQVGSN